MNSPLIQYDGQMPPQLEVIRLEGNPAKPPILLLHGAWLGAWCWRDWMTLFNAHGYTVIAPSYRAHGHSSHAASLRWTRLSHYVEDAISVASQLESPPIIIAHSMGGAVAQGLLETVKAAALVLVASVPPAGALGAALRLAQRHPVAFARINLMLSLLPAVSTPALVREMFYSASTPEATVLETAALVQDESYSAFLGMLAFKSKPLELPVLVVGGESDGIFSVAELLATAKFFGAPLNLYANTGHNLMLEPNRNEIVLEILAWLEFGVA